MAGNIKVPEAPESKPAYSISEVAALLGLHPATVSKYVTRGELRSARLGYKTVRITHEALMDFLREKEEESMRELSEKAAAKKKGRGPQG
jgi:excisionase family DNA binding protein